MPNWVHNGITVEGPSKVLFDLAEAVVNKSVAIDEEESQRGPISRRIAPSFEKRYTTHDLSYGTLRDIVKGSKHYDEFCEVIEPEGVLVDFDTVLTTPSPKVTVKNDGNDHFKQVYEWPEDDEIIEIQFSFDTKWTNQPTLFNIALLELAMELDPELGKKCISYSWGSEEMLHFENTCLVVNQVTINEETIYGPHIIYQGSTNRNSLYREDKEKMKDLQIVEMKVPITEVPGDIAKAIFDELGIDQMSWSVEKILPEAFKSAEYWYLTFEMTSDKLMAFMFYKAVAKLGYSFYNDDGLEFMPYVASPHFRTHGEVVGHTVPVNFNGSTIPTFVYGERFVNWSELRKEEELVEYPF